MLYVPQVWVVTRRHFPLALLSRPHGLPSRPRHTHRHQGFVTPEYTPVGRGFDHSFGFLEGGEDHWTSATFNGPKCKPNGVDLSFGFRNGSEIVVKPALGMNGTYTGYLFNDAAVKAVHESAAPGSPPLFLYYAMHNTHAPVEAPENYVGLYNNTPWAGTLEQTFNAQVSFVDDALKNLTTALKETGMWNNSLVVVQTDNGAPVTVAGSNLPLKGGKGSSWEGGTRTPAFVTGGILPQAMRGQTLKGMAHISDWYATFAGRAGLPAQADPAGPAKPDSHDLWPWLSGQAPKSPRVTMVYDHRMYADPGNATAAVGAMRVGNLKLVHGPFKQASWYGVFSPNSTQPKPSTAYTQCSIEQPCLFDLDADPTEHVDIAQQRPDDVKQLTAQFRALADEYHPPPHGPPEETRQYCDAMHNNHDFVAPWKMQQGHE